MVNDVYEQGYLGIHQYNLWTRSVKVRFQILFAFDSNRIGRTGNWIGMLLVDRFAAPPCEKETGMTDLL
jgi:hypothetical protein